jgi:quinol monooxygenase YgiN
MSIARRVFIAGAAAAAAAGSTGLAAASKGRDMYGLIGKMTAKPGERDALIAVLVEGVAGMPGCLSYVVANDPADPDLIWITEAWESKDAHAASLTMPSVRAAIAKGRPLIAGMASVAETAPVGGHGLVPTPAVPR